MTVGVSDVKRVTELQAVDHAGPFYVVGRALASDDYAIVATSAAFRNAAKRASELRGKRYGWDDTYVAVDHPYGLRGLARKMDRSGIRPRG